MHRQLAKILAPVYRALSNVALRATVVLVNAESRMQTLQLNLRNDETKESVEHFEPYGFTSKPNSGAEAITLFFNGDRSHGVAVVVAGCKVEHKSLDETRRSKKNNANTYDEHSF